MAASVPRDHYFIQTPSGPVNLCAGFEQAACTTGRYDRFDGACLGLRAYQKLGCPAFPDVDGHWAGWAIDAMTDPNLPGDAEGAFVHGHADGTFRPDEPLRREHWAVLLYEIGKHLPNLQALGTTCDPAIEQVFENTFVDHDQVHPDVREQVCVVTTRWFALRGEPAEDGRYRFDPAGHLTAGELYAAVVEFLGFEPTGASYPDIEYYFEYSAADGFYKPGTSEPEWYVDAMKTLLDNLALVVDDVCGPDPRAPATRGLVAAQLYVSLLRAQESLDEEARFFSREQTLRNCWEPYGGHRGLPLLRHIRTAQDLRRDGSQGRTACLRNDPR